jgi:hypothetical protein
MFAPFQMKLARSGREPDVMYIAENHRDRLKTNHLSHRPICDRDRERRSQESRSLQSSSVRADGVPVWLIDPDRKESRSALSERTDAIAIAELADGVIREPRDGGRLRFGSIGSGRSRRRRASGPEAAGSREFCHNPRDVDDGQGGRVRV